VATLLAEYRHERKPLPGQGNPVRTRRPAPAGPVVNTSYLALRVGCATSSLFRPPNRQLIIEAARELGVAPDTYLSSAINGELGGRAWLPAIGLSTLPELTRHLQTACYLVIAFLSGMRDSEVKHLRRGCLHAWRDQTGRPIRHKVTSLAFKGEQATDGVEATWVVGTPVARAVTVLERLQPADQLLLFAVLPTSRGHGRVKANSVKTSQATNYDIAGFVSWINTYCAAHERDDAVPDVNGRSWPLTTRQFRRTLAWFIARQPGGSIAGAIQYRHLSVQMFEGYANPRELHQAGEKSLVSRSGRRPAGLLGTWGSAA
jgi:integrase